MTGVEPFVLWVWAILSVIYGILVLIELRQSLLDLYFVKDAEGKIIAEMQMRAVVVRWVAASFNLVFLFFVASGFVFSAPTFVYITIVQLALLCLDIGSSLYSRYRLLKTP